MIDAAKALVLVFVVAILQTTVFSSVDILGGTPDTVLVLIVCIGLLRGPIVGALCGFLAGLVADVATLDILGVTSLLLVIAGYWIGRYGAALGRERRSSPYLPVVAATVLYAIGALVLRAILGESPSARLILVDSLFPDIALNLIVAFPIFALCRRLFRPPLQRDRAAEVELLG
jgi:rod shape-determining protein MreD